MQERRAVVPEYHRAIGQTSDIAGFASLREAPGQSPLGMKCPVQFPYWTEMANGVLVGIKGGATAEGARAVSSRESYGLV